MIQIVVVNNVSFEVETEWENTSFSHPFGLEESGQYNIISIKIQGNPTELIDILNDSIIKMIEKEVNK